VDFPILDLLEEPACYVLLLHALRRQALPCPDCRGWRYGTHRSRRHPVLDYRCAACGRVLSAATRMQHRAWARLPRGPLPDCEVEADEMFKNTGDSL
jgi:hypothetical protein